MKLLQYILFVFCVLFIGGCDRISENERLIPVDKIPLERTIILEDYTGQKCVNCPKAHEEIETLLETYGDNLIPVSIHAGSFSLSGFQTTAGNEYNTFFGVEAYPTGLINRKKTSTGDFNLLGDIATWQSAVRDIIWQKSGYELTLKNSYNSVDSLLNISITVNDLSNTNAENLSLQLWLTENNIVATQYLADGSRDKEYVHKHVLRDAINGTWGEKISFENNVAAKQYNYSFKTKKWNAANCDVIAFIYNSNTKEIIEATKKAAI